MNPPNRLLRWWRALASGRGSVARTTDRVQAFLVLASVLLAVAAIPFAAATGSEVYAAQKQQSVRELAEARPVTATFLADGPPVSVNGRSGAAGGPVPTEATWRTPEGAERVGPVFANEGTRRGDTVRIWVDRGGAVVGPPLTAAAVVVNAVAAAVGLWLAACLALATGYGIAVFALNRYRAGKWQREWFAELKKNAHS
ncbi:hypothetical protein [Amycolatopsis sp. NPDC051903]|uniref:Rv1733c family protein n=1 Tax=Amycolatopsis sp. NPDC051903 TaxID=3363936 RepID=UPI00379700DA